jgi:hypothetical protein
MNSKQGEKMGHKGVSKRKPKRSKSLSNNNNVSSNTREGSSVQSLVKDNSATLSRGGTNPATGTNKKTKKESKFRLM